MQFYALRYILGRLIYFTLLLYYYLLFFHLRRCETLEIFYAFFWYIKEFICNYQYFFVSLRTVKECIPNTYFLRF